jgi:hypothetical protein
VCRFVIDVHTLVQSLRWLCDSLSVRLYISRADSGLRLGSACGKAVADKENVGALASIRHQL